MATKKATTTTTATEVKPKKERKPREKKAKIAVLRPHPKYPEFLQALSVDGWILIEPVGNWQAKVPLLHPAIGDTVKLILGESPSTKVITPEQLSNFTIGCFSGTCCTDTLNSDTPCDAPELGNAGDIGLARDAEFTEDDFLDDDEESSTDSDDSLL